MTCTTCIPLLLSVYINTATIKTLEYGGGGGRGIFCPTILSEKMMVGLDKNMGHTRIQILIPKFSLDSKNSYI